MATDMRAKARVMAKNFGQNIESDLALEFLRVVEQAAIESAKTMGQGDRRLADHVATARQAIGYAEVCALLDGTLSEKAAFEKTLIRTRQLAKRQETWFRHQAQAVWLEIDENDPPAHVAGRVQETWRQHGPTPVLSP